MAFDADRSFETKNGFIISQNAGVFSGSGIPVDVAPEGSIYLDTSSDRVYKRIENEWKNQWFFPKDIIASSEIYTVEENRQHIVMNRLTLDGSITIDGTLGVI